MFKNFCNRALIAVLLVTAVARSAQAQAPIGARAQGMGGAFVAVADDASAVYWNPAGIATGAFVSGVIDFGQQNSEKSGIVGISATAIGLAYYRAQYYGTDSEKPAVSGVQGREEVGRSVHAIATSVAGVSLVQSLSEHLVIGATPKIMRGAREDASSNAFDVDAGAMYYDEHIRLGFVARNLTTPAFARATAGSASEDEVTLSRELRAGAAWGSGWTGISRVITSADVDLMTRHTPGGDRRDVAGGVETWWMNQRLGLRGGVRRSTIGDARAAFAAGISAGLTQGMQVEAHVTRGHRDERSWSVGARMSF